MPNDGPYFLLSACNLAHSAAMLTALDARGEATTPFLFGGKVAGLFERLERIRPDAPVATDEQGRLLRTLAKRLRGAGLPSDCGGVFPRHGAEEVRSILAELGVVVSELPADVAASLARSPCEYAVVHGRELPQGARLFADMQCTDMLDVPILLMRGPELPNSEYHPALDVVKALFHKNPDAVVARFQPDTTAAALRALFDAAGASVLAPRGPHEIDLRHAFFLRTRYDFDCATLAEELMRAEEGSRAFAQLGEVVGVPGFPIRKVTQLPELLGVSGGRALEELDFEDVDPYQIWALPRPVVAALAHLDDVGASALVDAWNTLPTTVELRGSYDLRLVPPRLDELLASLRQLAQRALREDQDCWVGMSYA